MKEDLTRLEDAQESVLSRLPRTGSETVPLGEALGRVAAADVVATDNVPPFANSAMDGYAVRAEDVQSAPVVLEVVAGVAAGAPTSTAVESGQAVKIMTGGVLPTGADAVVPVELTAPVEGTGVQISESVTPGAAVREAGTDIAAGATVVEMGTRLSPYHLGLLASVGESSPAVAVRPVVAVMSTGNEVMSPATPELAPGQIRDSNRSIMHGLLAELGIPVLDLGILRDDRDVVKRTLTKAAEEADVVVTSGGVSMGEFDYIKAVMGELGDATSWKVAMQPAKPFTFGMIDGTPVFGLPGNPVSVAVAFEQFLRPGLLSMMGATALYRPRVKAIAGTDFKTAIAKTVFLRIRLEQGPGGLTAWPAGGQSSHQLGALAAADGFGVVPRGVDVVAEGEEIWVELHREQV